MMFRSREEVESLRQEYTGRRIMLDGMDDAQSPPVGTVGTCKGVDDIGDLLMSWDTGSSLKLIPGEDRFHII